MNTTSLSVTELVRGFSDYVNRVAYRGERFILLKGKKPVAELRPIASGLPLDELDATLRSLPSLSPNEAIGFADDIENARAELPAEGLPDPWQS